MRRPGHNRADRVARAVLRALSEGLSRRVKDPRLDGVLITDVRMSSDLRHATVLWHLISGGDEDRQAEAEAGFHKAAPLLRSIVGGQVRLRAVPELRFRYDAGLDHARKMEAILDALPPAATPPDEGESEA